MANSKMSLLALLIVWTTFISVCEAGEYCTTSEYETQYCSAGCCGDLDDECCSRVGLIVGLVIGGVTTVIIIAVVICLCRRRQQTTIIYRQFDTAPVVVQQHTTNNTGGFISTAGTQPGISYPQQFQPHPTVPMGNTSRPTSPTGGYPYTYPPDLQNPSGFNQPPPYEVSNPGVGRKD